VGNILLYNWLCFVPWSFFFVKSRYIDKRDLRENGAYTVAEIIDIKRYGRGQPITIYHYMVNDIIYNGSLAKWLDGCPDKIHCKGAKFRLLYSSQNPSVHEIHIDKQLNDSLKIGVKL